MAINFTDLIAISILRKTETTVSTNQASIYTPLYTYSSNIFLSVQRITLQFMGQNIKSLAVLRRLCARVFVAEYLENG